jgi:thiamine kinase-like enzyme
MDDLQFEAYILPSINTILENTKTDRESTRVFHQIKTEMKAKLNDKIVMRSICHGDLKIENGIFDSKMKLKGIFDWDKSEREGITITDLACLLATSIRAQYFKNSSLVDFMKEFKTVPEEFIPSYTFYFETTQTSYISPRLAILYYWVDRVYKLLKYYHHHSDEEWIKENINPVLGRVHYFLE